MPCVWRYVEVLVIDVQRRISAKQIVETSLSSNTGSDFCLFSRFVFLLKGIRESGAKIGLESFCAFESVFSGEKAWSRSFGIAVSLCKVAVPQRKVVYSFVSVRFAEF